MNSYNYNGVTIITIGDVYRCNTPLPLYEITIDEYLNDQTKEVRASAISHVFKYVSVSDTFMILDFIRINGYPYVKIMDAEHGITGLWVIGIPKSGVATYFRNVREEEQEEE